MRSSSTSQIGGIKMADRNSTPAPAPAPVKQGGWWKNFGIFVLAVCAAIALYTMYPLFSAYLDKLPEGTGERLGGVFSSVKGAGEKFVGLFPGIGDKYTIKIKNGVATPDREITFKYREKTYFFLSGTVVVTDIAGKSGKAGKKPQKKVSGCSEDAQLVLIEADGKTAHSFDSCLVEFTPLWKKGVTLKFNSSKFNDFEKDSSFWWPLAATKGYDAEGTLTLRVLTASQKVEAERKAKEAAEKAAKAAKEKLGEAFGTGVQDAWDMITDPENFGVTLPPLTPYPEVPKKSKP